MNQAFYTTHHKDLSHLKTFKQCWNHYINKGIHEGRKLHDGPKIIKIFLMHKDEEDLLEDWIVYHGILVGFKNLHIIDNLSNNKCQIIFSRYSVFGINVIPTTTDLNQREHFITRIMKEQTPFADFFIKMDTDEFLCYTNDGLTVLNDPPGFRKFISSIPFSPHRYKAIYTSCGLVFDPDYKIPAQEMTYFQPLTKTGAKTFFSATIEHCDLGSHHGKVKEPYNDIVIDIPLVWLHLTKTSYRRYIEKSYAVLYSHNYISPKDSPGVQLQKLQKICSLNCMSVHKAHTIVRHLSGISSTKTFMDNKKLRYQKVTLNFDLMKNVHHVHTLSSTGKNYIYNAHFNMYLKTNDGNVRTICADDTSNTALDGTETMDSINNSNQTQILPLILTDNINEASPFEIVIDNISDTKFSHNIQTPLIKSCINGLDFFIRNDLQGNLLLTTDILKQSHFYILPLWGQNKNKFRFQWAVPLSSTKSFGRHIFITSDKQNSVCQTLKGNGDNLGLDSVFEFIPVPSTSVPETTEPEPTAVSDPETVVPEPEPEPEPESDPETADPEPETTAVPDPETVQGDSPPVIEIPVSL